jgi:hypothetical protein
MASGPRFLYTPPKMGTPMETVEVIRDGRTDQFSIVMTRGIDTIRCMVSVALGDAQDNRSVVLQGCYKAKSFAARSLSSRASRKDRSGPNTDRKQTRSAALCFGSGITKS